MRKTGRRYDGKRIAAGRYWQRTAQGNFGLKRNNTIRSFKKRVMRSGLTGKGVFKKRFNKKRFSNWIKKYK